MPRRPVDVLTPFIKADSNRPENLLVQMHGFLYNRTAAYAINMLREYDKWSKIFPNLKIFCNMSPYQIYKATANYDVIDIFFAICDTSVTEEDPDKFARLIIDTVETIDKMDMRYGLITPLTAYALNQIAKEKCCKRILVTKLTPFNQYEEKYIGALFEDNVKKVELVSGDFYEVWKDNVENVTTSFINDLSITEPIAQFSKDNNMPDYINRQLFLLRMNNKIVDIDPVTGSAKYTCTEQINELEKVKIHVGTISSDLYPVTDTKVPVLKI